MAASHSIARSGTTCLLCVPLRLGVFVAAILTTIGSVFTIWFKQNHIVHARLYFGGYTALSGLLSKVVDYVGIVWGIWGIYGCWTMKEGYLQMYNYYNMLRVATWGYILYSDFGLIWNCEEWALDLEGAVQRNGWNPIMYAVGRSGSCVPTRFYFTIFVPAGILLFLYLIWVNMQLQQLIASEPAYLLRLPAVKLDPAYYAYSLGEKDALLGKRSDPRSDLPVTRGNIPAAPGGEKSAHAPSAESHGAVSEKRERPWDKHSMNA